MKQRCLDMLNECITQVEQHLPDQKNVFVGLTALCPDVILSQTRRVDFQQLPFMHLMEANFDTIENEYRQLIHVNWKEEFPENQIPNDTETFWTLMHKKASSSGKFLAISVYALSCLTIPLSNAIVERLFSTVTFVKNKQRNRIKVKTLAAITRIRAALHFQSKCCKDFQVTERMFQLFNSKNMYLSQKDDDCEVFDL